MKKNTNKAVLPLEDDDNHIPRVEPHNQSNPLKSKFEFINVTSETGVAVALEAQRLAEKFNKDFLDSNDLVQILGVGLNNVRELMRSTDFPVLKLGNRKVISVIAFAIWSLNSRSL